MIMEPFEVYRYYLALRLHFTTDKYDVIEQRGRVRATKNSFLKRKDMFAIRKVAETYSDKDIVDFLVANFVSGDRWGGVFDVESKERYHGWKKRIEAISYTFKKELDKAVLFADKNNMTFEDLYKCNSGQHPPIVKMYLRNDISIETLVILNKLNNFTDQLDQDLKDDLVWPDTSRIIKKYSPFLEIKKEKYNEIYRRAIGPF
ncbi:59 protein [uncultured Caudovirales phage]|uniref:59 protein n=1 Tax=uncultured Caudovirales phage TaxID=2100421 RepID=A0A6J7WVU0_9CAUD|nr:59 protein [uncultured Caudovirales phage]